MNEYLSQLYDWISRTDNTFSSRRSRDEFVSKMMNEDDYNTQIYNWVNGKDASFSSKYTTDQFKAKTLANYTPLKKKDESELTSQEVATESITKEEPPVTLSDASKSEFDYESFIDKDEEFALPELEDQLSGKGYSIEKTGLGDALLVTDNITQEQVEIDLQPISWFGKKKYREEEISKVRKLIETPTDARRKALSANQLEVYSEDRVAYIDNLKRLYPDISFDYIQDPSRGGLLKVTKGSSVGEFPIAMGTGNDAKQFADINRFLYQNITEDEASSIIKRQDVDEYKRIVEEYSKIEKTIDISMESAETDFYSKDYFKGLFKALEQSGISVPQEAKQELEKGTVTRQEYRGNNPVTIEVDMDKSMIDSGVQKYFGSNPEVLAKINQYNLSGTVSVRKSKIDRAKKLAIEDFLDKSPDRESTKEILRRVNKDASEQQLDIETNLTMAKSHLTKMVSSVKQSAEEISRKYPNLKIDVIEDEKGNLVDIISSEPVKEVDDLKKGIKDALDVYTSLAYKSKYDYDKIASKAETTGQYIELANKSYDLFDTAMADINNALTQMAGGFTVMQTLAEGAIEDVTGVTGISLTPAGIGVSSESKMKSVREDMAESREKLDQAYKTQRTYQEAIKEGSKFEFGTRQFATQAPNIALAMATSGAGSAVGMSEAAISTLVATQFGVNSAGQKYDELTTRQEIASIAEKAKKDLESVKGMIPDDEYFAQMYELERAIEDGKIDFWQKIGAVTVTGLVEGLVTKYIGTVPNSIKILKDIKVKPGQFMDDILRSNYKATLGAFKEFGKRTGEEIIEETAIEALSQVNDYAFLGDQIDLSSLDDVAVTSIITSGAMNTPSMAYSTILTQTNVNRYKSKIESLTGEITTLRDMLSDPDLTNIQRSSIHNNISNIISQVADQTTNMEGDALLLGADNIKELMTLSGVRNSMLKKAGVENDDSYDVANAKIDTYLKGVDQKEGKKFVDQMKYIDGRRNDILKSINYEGAVERVFGEKGKEIAKDLDPSLTPQQKYVEVYGQVRQDINDNALKEFNDAIQKQEAGDISDAKPAEGVQEMEEGVREPSVQEKSKTALKISSDTKTALDNKKTKQELTVDENGNTIVNEVEISKEDANLELDRLSLLAEKGRLTVDEFQKSYFGQSTDTNTLSEAKKQIESNPVEFINSIKKGFNETDTEQDVAEKVDERAYKPEEVKETTDAAAFAASQSEAIAQRKDDKLQVTPLTQQDAQKIIDEGGKLFMTEDGKSGAYVTADGYMGGLFKQPGANRTQAAKVLQDARIEAGGKFFDAFGINVESGKGTNLEDIYIKNGFRPIARMTFNPEFAPKGWEKTNLKNRPDNVFFVYDPTYKATKGEGQRIENYDQAYELAKNFSPEAAKIEAEVQQLRELFKSPDQRKQVDNALNALSKIAPDVEVIVHESEQAYAEVTNEQGRNQKTAGTYQETEVNGRKRKVIHINPEKANVRTVAHEVFHAILLNMVKTDAEAQRLTEAMMKAVAKVASPELKAYLDEFASNYDENIRAEEKLAELVGKLASEYSSLPKPTQNIIKRWLDRLAKMFGLKPFTDEQVIDVLNTISGKVSRGEAITNQDVSAISEGASTFFSDPTTINKKQVAGEVKVSDTPAELSFVTSKDIIDIDSLINEISSKGQKVWFWVADQLGRGMYMDTQVGTEHFLDAGPSYALDPKNRAKKAIWATGKGENEMSKLIDKSDYIFIMSGSPIRSKLFNKRVFNILKNRVGDYNAFKKGALNNKPTKAFSDALANHNSWESLVDSPDRKKLLNAIESVKEKKDTPLKTFLQDNNAFIDLNELRDGFYAQNDFQMNDVMLVLKPTAFGGKSDHSTYENDILGDVVGVPNKKVNAYDLMPEDVRQKYSDAMTESQKAQVVAPYGIGVKGISPRKQFVGVKANLTADQKSSKKKAEDMIKKGMDPLQIKQQTGFEVGVDGKLRLELDASKSKVIGPGLRHRFGQTTVSEVLEFTDLLKAYPFISDIPIFFNDGFPSAGLYDGVRIRMNSALINEYGNGDYLGTLLHEIQHIIQIEEGFTGGANPSTIRDEVKKAVRNLNNKAINAIQTQVEKLTGIRPELTITEGDRKELTEVYENNEAALINMLSRHTVEDVDAVVKVIRNADNSYYAVENLMEKFGMPNKEAVLLNGIHGVFDMKLYEALSGEVEARNVQNRRTMTEAERRNSLAAETETISQLMSVESGKYINVPIKRSEQIRRKQVANYDNVIKTAKENNISDAAIRQYLSENGMTLNEADAVVKNYNDRIRKIRQKKEGVFTKENKVLKNLDSFRRYVSSGKGHRPKSMQVGQESEQGFIDSQSKAAMYEFRRLEKAIKGYKGDVNALKSNLEAYMRGDTSVSLPENIQKIAFKMRTHIDGLSKMLVETGAVDSSESKENILNNIGSYMTRSYEVFNKKNWKEKVTDEVLQNAKNYLRDSMRDQAANEASKTNRPVDVVLEEMVDDQVNKLLDRESAREYVSNANVSSKNIGVLKRRVNIPAPLRALMGEYTDTAKNYIVTVNKIATLAAQQNFLNEMKLAGMDVFFFEKPTGNFKAQIAAEGSKTMDPLNGLYTTPEILKALKGGDIYGFNLGPAQWMLDAYLKGVGTVKYNKTILSPGTHAKNFLGNMYFMLANGHLDPKDWHKAAKAIAADFGIITSEEAEAKMLEYVEAGVISQSVNLRDLKAMFSGDISSEQQFENKMTERFNKPNWSKIKEKPEQWYQAEDDFFKIIAYESNKARYSKAFHNKPFDQLNDTQKKEVLDRAIEVTKNTLPNYSRLPEIRKLMRAIPLVGTFISFHIEAIRTAYNTIHIAATEIKDPRTREIGIKRLSGILAMIGLKEFVLSSIGIGDDDDEIEESTRRFLPPWSTNSEIVIESVKDGKIIYRDLSASDPWGVIDRAMNGFMSGEDTLDGFIEAAKEVVGPFFDEDILIGAVKDSYEKSNSALPISENLEIVLKELYKAWEPGAVTSAFKIYKSENTTNEIVGQISGYKSREIDVVKTIGFKFRDVRSYPDGTIFAVTKKYSTAFRKFKEGEATAQEVQDAYNESNQSYKQIMSDVLKDYTAAIKLDADMSEVNQKMKDAGFSRYEIDQISSGMIPELSRNREDDKETGGKSQKPAKYSWEKSQKPAKYSWEK